MADVEALCKRVIVIHHGRILFDGALASLGDEFAAYKTIGVALENGNAPLDEYGEVIHREGDRVTLRVPKAETSRVAARLLADHDVARPHDRGAADRRRDRARLRTRAMSVEAAELPVRNCGRQAAGARCVDFYVTTMRTGCRGAAAVPRHELLLHAGMIAEPVIQLVGVDDDRGRSTAGRSTGSPPGSSRRTTSSGRSSAT